MSAWSMVIYVDQGLTAYDKAYCVGFLQLRQNSNISNDFPNIQLNI